MANELNLSVHIRHIGTKYWVIQQTAQGARSVVYSNDDRDNCEGWRTCYLQYSLAVEGASYYVADGKEEWEKAIAAAVGGTGTLNAYDGWVSDVQPR